MLETDAQTDYVAIRFAAGLPGFPDVHDFHLAPWGPPGSPYLQLRAVDNTDVGFVVVPPWVFYPDYEFDLDDAIVLAVVTLRDRPDEATLNLLGPIVVNRHTHDAAQVVLPTTSYSVRAPLAFAG